MTDTDETKRCSRCGTEYSGQSSPLGLCPACLMALGMSGIHESKTGSEASEPSRPADAAVAGRAVESPAEIRAHWRRHRWLAIPAAALALALVMLAAMMLRVTPAGSERPQPLASVVRFRLPLPTGTEALDGAQVAVSPDGTSVALAGRAGNGRSHLWLRRLQAADWIELPGTEGAVFPFWSPDSRHVGFFADRRLKRIDVSSGLTQILCNAPSPRGGAWGAQGVIVFGDVTLKGLSRVSDSGGAPQPATSIEGPHIQHGWPRFLEDGRHFVFFANATDQRHNGTYIAAIDDPSMRLVASRVAPGIAIDDLFLFSRNRALTAQRFTVGGGSDEGTMQTIGGVDDVTGTVASGPTFDAVQGVLIYRTPGGRLSQLMWFDRDGRAIGTVGEPADDADLDLSPDGRSLAVARYDDRRSQSNLWLIDLARGGTSRVTFGTARDTSPIWSPDAARLIFASRRDAPMLLATDAHGGGKEQQIAVSPLPMQPTDWSRDGLTVAYTATDPKTGLDVWALPIGEGDRKPWAMIQTPFNESHARFSPDGRWVAYVSDETGRDEVFVRSYPQPDAKWLVSTGGGTEPRWRGDGRELLFIAADGTLMAARIDARPPAFQADQPMPLFPMRGARAFAMSPDARRFVVQTPLPDANADAVHVVLNWTRELR